MNSTKENLQVLFEDNHIIIINKRAGDITQGDKTGDKPLSDVIKEYIKEKYNKPGEVFIGTVHRLDRPTSGIVIFARTSKALTRLNKMLRDKVIDKTYWALVKNAPIKATDTITNFLKKDTKKNKSFVYKKEIEGCKKAVLHYKILQKLESYCLLEIDLETGRHHQIRTQLSHIGSVIKGDLKYGASRSNKDGSISLHARKIKFTHPVSKEEIAITAPTPKDIIWNACR
ncbi:ribosomal large subunit pseudouridine synthase D [Polaribacter irgensii 23-P]|uniref:Ribosomal large subunit pseudouridine synthase D n=1 Tax=Polaribacter irgensii 23-P TaxID=313594 RepID=A4BVZ1_9FLAO|nr:RluA family pseudouridine synthase [Polaribacter irgensii]EAR13132.1 ribosomal large subunit pseudouridine synthase D [Polaribacter irgensii 23-P]